MPTSPRPSYLGSTLLSKQLIGSQKNLARHGVSINYSSSTEQVEQVPRRKVIPLWGLTGARVQITPWSSGGPPGKCLIGLLEVQF